MGMIGRMFGYACDSLVEVEYVLYNGTVVHANQGEWGPGSSSSSSSSTTTTTTSSTGT